MNSIIRKTLLPLICVILSITSIAQTTTATISGHVTDNDGALPDAVITAQHTPTGKTYHTITGKDGSYHINGVVAGGPYIVKAEMMGHRNIAITNAYAPLGDNLILDFSLPITATSLEEVVISADAMDASMNAMRSGVGTHIGLQTIQQTPTTTRTLNDIMKLTPQSTASSTGFAVGGGNYRGSSVTIDGASFNNAFGIGSSMPAGGNPLSLDAIEQISINITPFDVRQSGFLGGAINMVTKRGGNEWSASLYNYTTSSTFSGQHIGDVDFSGSNTLSNLIGFTVGGPIIKDKLFIFLNAEYTPETVPGSIAHARQSDTSSWGGETGVNRPTIENMDAIRNHLIQHYGYDPGHYQDYSISTPDYKLLARLDWHISPTKTFNLRLSHTGSKALERSNSMSILGGSNTWFSLDGNSYSFNRYSEGRLSEYSMVFESAQYFKHQNFTSVSAEYNSHFDNNKGNHIIRATWSYQNEPRSHYGDIFPTVDILEPYYDGDIRKYASFTTFGIDPFTYRTANRVSTLNITTEQTYAIGIHNTLIGAQLEHNHIENIYMTGGAGWYVFDSWQSFVNNSLPVLFMATYANGDDPYTTPTFMFNHLQPSLYAQDEMDLNQYFKLTVGARADVPIILFGQDNYNAQFAQVATLNPNSSFANLNTSDYPLPSFNFSPRMGFNWDVIHNHRLILRGGTGIFYGRIPNVWLINAIANSNVLQNMYIANPSTGNPVIPFYADRNAIIDQITSSHTAPTSAVILSRDLLMPSNWKNSLVLDIRLPWDFKGTIEGIYSRSYNEVAASALGYALGDSIQLPGEPRPRATYQSEGIKNSADETMGGCYLYNVNNLHGHYISLTAQLQKHFGFGLDVMAAYTHSNSTSVTDGSGDQAANLSQVSTVDGDNSPELGYSAYVAPNRVIVQATYTINLSRHTSTKLSLFYEGYNVGMVNYIAQSRVSYLMNSIDQGRSSRLIYIPTEEELQAMPFTSDENRAAYEQFIQSDSYLNTHRGQYSTRNGSLAPWTNRVSLRLAQEFYIDVANRPTTLEIGVDLNNAANLINSEWGTYKQINTQTILNYRNGQYTFTQPKWTPYYDLLSTWQLMLHLKYSF